MGIEVFYGKGATILSHYACMTRCRCSLGVGMGRATWTKAAADRSANIMEGVRRSNASRQRISSREGMYRAIDSLPA